VGIDRLPTYVPRVIGQKKSEPTSFWIRPGTGKNLTKGTTAPPCAASQLTSIIGEVSADAPHRGLARFRSEFSFPHTGRMTTAGVDTERHVWDGLEHAVFMDPDIPASRQVYEGSS
jgi:hypothetical protein